MGLNWHPSGGNIILTADLHLTDKARDWYRWSLFDWLAKKIHKYHVRHVIILGDLTDAKDKHSAGLVNNVVENLLTLRAAGAEIIVVCGNHDCIDPTSPFFEFIGRFSDITFIKEPCIDETPNMGGVIWLPHSRDPESDIIPFLKKHGPVEAVFMHQTFEGVRASNGQQLSGISRDVLKDVKIEAFSGDIHVPQSHGKLTYVGSPYHIHFGDQFEPRVLLLGEGLRKNLRFKTVRKWQLQISDLSELQNEVRVARSDQVKVEVCLGRESLGEWSAFRRQILEHVKRAEWDLCGLRLVVPKAKTKKHKELEKTTKRDADPLRILDDFGLREKLDETQLRIGKKIVRSILGDTGSKNG